MLLRQLGNRREKCVEIDFDFDEGNVWPSIPRPYLQVFFVTDQAIKIVSDLMTF